MCVCENRGGGSVILLYTAIFELHCRQRIERRRGRRRECACIKITNCFSFDYSPYPIPPLRLHNCQMRGPSYSIEWDTCCFCKRFITSFLSSPLAPSPHHPLFVVRHTSRLHNPITLFILSFFPFISFNFFPTATSSLFV